MTGGAIEPDSVKNKVTSEPISVDQGSCAGQAGPTITSWLNPSVVVFSCDLTITVNRRGMVLVIVVVLSLYEVPVEFVQLWPTLCPRIHGGLHVVKLKKTPYGC